MDGAAATGIAETTVTATASAATTVAAIRVTRRRRRALVEAADEVAFDARRGFRQPFTGTGEATVPPVCPLPIWP